ncbi:MAG: N-acetylmuramoyl-L-alanine amidase [Verrucomicrobiota bacterium]|nr:N-acetylmuramoyl-L-alanine amidase [Verrucomicrobiota bacterium]
MPSYSRQTVQQGIAWGGLILVVLSLVCLELLPRVDRPVAPAKTPSGRSIARVVIDAGHGGKDSGAIRNGVLEKDLTLDVAVRLQRRLQASGVATIMTRSGDEWISLAGRAATANHEQDCLFVSIHFDEGNRSAATGVQTFYAAHQIQNSSWPAWLPFLQAISGEAPNLKSQSLAGFVQDSLVAKTQAFNRGTKAEQFYVVANVRHPAVLIEGGFLTNNDDIGKLATETYREQLAGAIADGVLRYCALSREQAGTLALQSGTSE